MEKIKVGNGLRELPGLVPCVGWLGKTSLMSKHLKRPRASEGRSLQDMRGKSILSKRASAKVLR